jgi:hypothetical protein
MPTKIASILAFPRVAEWHKQVARKAVGTANLYLQSLYTYWTNSIKSRGFKNIDQYVQEVKEQQKSDDVRVRRRWASDLQDFLYEYKSARTKRSLTTDSRNVFVAALKSLLEFSSGRILKNPNRERVTFRAIAWQDSSLAHGALGLKFLSYW